MKKELIKKLRQSKLFKTACFAFVLLFVSLLYFIFSQLSGSKNLKKESADNILVDSVATVVSSEKCDNCVRRNLDGVYVGAGEENPPLAAMIIENHFDARPQSGLSKAKLVYEAEAEGRITRFLAIFDGNEKQEKIGPIRSVRPYFVDWANELGAVIVHCGGSPQALTKISAENIFDLNEFYNGNYFWRAKEKAPPHNVFISGENINKFLQRNKILESNFLSWQFKDDVPLEVRPEQAEIKINFLFSQYVVIWKYNRESNEYERFQGGEKHEDADGSQIKAKNIIVEYAETEEIDEALRIKINNTGAGKALICLDGKCEKGEWRKANGADRTKFYKISGEEFDFNAGTTWIEIVRPEYEVGY